MNASDECDASELKQLRTEAHFHQGRVAALEETLRDRFAMAALTGLWSDAEGTLIADSETAKACYHMADAMLAARQQKAAQ